VSCPVGSRGDLSTGPNPDALIPIQCEPVSELGGMHDDHYPGLCEVVRP
jgi:hypothetical protein